MDEYYFVGNARYELPDVSNLRSPIEIARNGRRYLPEKVVRTNPNPGSPDVRGMGGRGR